LSKIVSVHSFRGGTGKSNLTANLVTLLASQGKRVGVVDTDIQSPGIHVIFGLEEKEMNLTLNDFLWGRCSVEQAAYDVSSILQKEPKAAASGGKIFLIPSSVKTGEIARVLSEGYDVSILSNGFREIVHRLKLDCLFIDTHPGMNEETLLSIALSDVLVLLLRPDRQDFQGTAVTVEVARKLDVPKLLMVVNMALLSFDFDALENQVETTYGATVAGILPLIEEMTRLGSSDVFCLRYPQHPYTQILRAICGQVME
jgi:MinD-like ATPase involved in chromosome partitioning or flagellar assembly